MKALVILTVIGSDRPGLTQALADAVLKAGGNWLESHLSSMAGKFVGSVLVELPSAALIGLRDAAEAIAGLAVTIVEAGTAPAPPGQTITLDLVGQDRPGIVREITAALAPLGVNIAEMDTDVARGSWSGETLFKARAELQIPASVMLDEVRDALERISGEIMVDFNLIRPLGR